MAPPNLSLLAIFFLFLFTAVGPKATTAIPTSSADFLLTLLRNRGHTLFANAISTSDLLFDILRLRAVTLFAPPNPSLYILDLTQTPPIYLSTLRLHVVPYLLSLSLPANATPPPTLIRTLLPSRLLHLTANTTADGAPSSLLINGVELVLPPLYYSTSLAVYRLRRSLSFPDLYRPVSRPRNSRVPAQPNRTAEFEEKNSTVLPSVNWTVTSLVPPPPNRPVFSPVNWTVMPPRNRPVFSPINWTVTPLVPPPPPNLTVFDAVNWTFTPLVSPPVPAPNITAFDAVNWTFTPLVSPSAAPPNITAFDAVNWTFTPLVAPAPNITVFDAVNWTFTPNLMPQNLTVPDAVDNLTVIALFNRTVPSHPPAEAPKNISVESPPPTVALDFGVIFAPPVPSPATSSVPSPAASPLHSPATSPAPSAAPIGAKISPALQMEGVKCGPFDEEDVRCALLAEGHVGDDDYMLRPLADHDL
ncbi:hypothetical protein Tsubulata_002000 [Turnera subulata]|uniref:FAS1 domain-containing protein n=1 Tax=Turnera subulata TaxID=218843 RepID=A0A9Q0FIT7_9ROSI|nr:hypothetical protein Tsubulata_002000 [Turnera subulata]